MADDELRACEREVEARPSAASWARLGQALARAGRADDAYRAAVRACAFDPSSDARALLRPGWPRPGARHSVSWAGLRRLAAPRQLADVPGGPIVSEIFDVGAGRVAYVTGGPDGATVGVDVLEERVVWRRPPGLLVGLAGDNLVVMRVVEGEATLSWLAPASGETHRTLLLGALTFQRPAQVALVGNATLAVVEASGERGVLSMIDLETGARRAHLELPDGSGQDRIHALGDALLTQGARGERLLAFARDGVLLWEREPGGFFCGRVGDELAFDTDTYHLELIGPGGSTRRSEEPASGGFTCVGEREIVMSDQNTFQAIDRATLRPIEGWQAKHGPRRSFSEVVVVATADAVLALDGSHWRAPDIQLVALEPRTGRELQRVPLPFAVSCDNWAPALVAGRLVLAPHFAGPLVVVEEPIDRGSGP